MDNRAKIKKINLKKTTFTDNELEDLKKLVEQTQVKKSKNYCIDKLAKKYSHAITSNNKQEETRIKFKGGSIVIHSNPNGYYEYRIKHSVPKQQVGESEQGNYATIKRSDFVFFAEKSKVSFKQEAFIEKVLVRGQGTSSESSSDFEQRVLNEYNCLKKLYPTIPKPTLIANLQNEFKKAYLAMPLIPGENFFDYLAANLRYLDVQTRHKIFTGFLHNLATCHNKDIVHGDIKPENCIIDVNQFIVTLIDFGFAFFETEKNQPHDRGSPAYMAPELRINGFTPSKFPRDIWAAGIVLVITYGATGIGEKMSAWLDHENSKRLKGNQDPFNPPNFPNLQRFNPEFSKRDDDEFNFEGFISPHLTSYSLKNIHILFQKMLSFNPEERPAVASVIKDFKNCYCKLDEIKYRIYLILDALTEMKRLMKESDLQSIREITMINSRLNELKSICDKESEKGAERNNQNKYDLFVKHVRDILSTDNLKQLTIKIQPEGKNYYEVKTIYNALIEILEEAHALEYFVDILNTKSTKENATAAKTQPKTENQDKNTKASTAIQTKKMSLSGQ